MQDAEKLRGLTTIDMHALMEDNYAEVVYTNSVVRHKRRRLNSFNNGFLIFPIGENYKQVCFLSSAPMPLKR